MVWMPTSWVALLEDASYFFAHRTSPASIRVLPSESVLFARSADNPLGILVYLVALAFLQRIFVLRFHVATTDVDGIEFVAADTAIEQLSAARFRIKGPFVTHLHNRYRERPVLVAHKKECPIAGLRIHGNAFLFARLRRKVHSPLSILGVLAGEIDVLATGAKNIGESTFVKFFGRID